MIQFLDPPEFVLCLFNQQNPVSLERRKVYQVVTPEPDDPAEYVRIVDESGEDYLFPRDWFAPMKLSPSAVEALSTPSEVPTRS